MQETVDYSINKQHRHIDSTPEKTLLSHTIISLNRVVLGYQRQRNNQGLPQH